MKEEMKAVYEFHKKMDISHRQRIGTCENTTGVYLLDGIRRGMQLYAEWLQDELQNGAEDARVLRAHLMIEELAECIEAMYNCDEVGVLDALADLLYVVIGSAVQFELPLHSAFWEVHRSNMTKEPQQSDPLRNRVRDKGPNYQPPNIAQLLQAARSDK